MAKLDREIRQVVLQDRDRKQPDVSSTSPSRLGSREFNNLLRQDRENSQLSETYQEIVGKLLGDADITGCRAGCKRTETHRRPERVPRSHSSRLLALFLLLASTLAGIPFGSAQADTHYYPLASVGWAAPSGPESLEIYSSGPVYGGGLGLDWGTKLAAQFRVDWWQQSGAPSSPIFVDSARSELRWIPATVRLEYAFTQGANHWIALAGAGVWFGRETFDVTLVGDERSVSLSTTQPAWSIGAGYVAERGALTFRLIGRWLGSSVQGKIAHGNTTVDGKDRATTGLWTFGMEIAAR